MEQNTQNFSRAELTQLLRTPAGQNLMALMQEKHSAELQQAMALIMAGRSDEAQRLLSPILQSPEAQSLLGQMGGNHG